MEETSRETLILTFELVADIVEEKKTKKYNLELKNKNVE